MDKWFILRLLMIAGLGCFAFALELTLVRINLGWLPLLLLLLLFVKKKPPNSECGTARTATPREVKAVEGDRLLGLMHQPKEPGLTVLFDFRRPHEEAMRAFLANKKGRWEVVGIDVVHHLMVAPTRAGKGTGHVVPLLLTDPRSALVIDIKGELFLETAEARRRMGHKVVCFDPFGVGGGQDTYSFLSEIDGTSPNAIDDLRSLADAMAVKTGSERDPHFIEMAQTYLTGMAAFVLAHSDDKTIQMTRPLLSDPAKMAKALELMRLSPAFDGALALYAHQMSHAQGEERGSVLTTVNRISNVLDGPPVKRATMTSTFRMKELFTDNVTIYIVLPADKVHSHKSLLRMLVNAAVQAGFRNGAQEARQVNFVLDEAASLGKLDSLMDLLNKGAGYGMKSSWYYQDMGQIVDIWGEAGCQTLLANCVQTFFATNDLKSAEYVANRTGDYTEVMRSGGETFNYERNAEGWPYAAKTRSASTSWSLAARKLWQASEVLKFDKRMAVTFYPGLSPIVTWNIRHYEFTPPRKIGFPWAAVQVAVFAAGMAALAVLAVLTPTGGSGWAR